MEKLEQLHKIMESSCSQYSYRRLLQEPFVIKDKAYATDAHIMIIAPKSLTSFSKKIENPEKVLNVIPNPSAFIKTFSLKNLKQTIAKIPYVDEYKNCDEDYECNTCNGDGEVEWEFDGYTKEDECPVCNGDGTLTEKKRIKTGKKVRSDKHVIQLNNAYFKHYYIEKLINLANLFSLKEIKLLNNPD